jgi:hypothetical protein
MRRNSKAVNTVVNRTMRRNSKAVSKVDLIIKAHHPVLREIRQIQP